MNKNNFIVKMGLAAGIILICAVVGFYFQGKNNGAVNDSYEESNIPAATNTAIAIDDSRNEGNLGKHECLSLFRVERGTKYTAESEVFALDFFQTFDTGAFFGKINNFRPGDNKYFSAFINGKMMEGKITTYLHLRADVCLYKQDLLNPKNGGSLYYYIEHYFCTNSCQTGEYEIRADLDADGNFVGYRQGGYIY